MASFATIEALIKLGIMGVGAIQKMRASHAAGQLAIHDGIGNPMDAAALASHFAAWEAAADAASAHASQRIEDRHKHDS
jgi:hypothetical protein